MRRLAGLRRRCAGAGSGNRSEGLLRRSCVLGGAGREPGLPFPNGLTGLAENLYRGKLDIFRGKIYVFSGNYIYLGGKYIYLAGIIYI